MTAAGCCAMEASVIGVYVDSFWVGLPLFFLFMGTLETAEKFVPLYTVT